MPFVLASTSRNDRRGVRHLISGSVERMSSIGRVPGNFVQSIGDGANQLFYTFAGGGGDGMEFEIFFSAKIAQRFEARAVGSSVELRGHHDQRLFRKSFAESRQLTWNNFIRVALL